MTRAKTAPEPTGLVIHGADRYDLIVWLFTLGGERAMRERMLRLARLSPGETVLDVGCGTGTLALLAKRQVGAGGVVYGVDPSPEMIARARKKAVRARLDLNFIEGAVQALPLGDASVDVVTSTLMLHHVPKKARPEIVREIKRVLKPGGRLLIVDFAKTGPHERTAIDRFHRHGAVNLAEVTPELETADFAIAEQGSVGEKKLHYVLATNGPATLPHAARRYAPAPQRHGLSAALVAIVALGGAALIAAHVGAATSLTQLLSKLATNPMAHAALAVVVLIVVLKIGFIGFVHRFGGGLLTRWLGVREETRD